MYIQHVLHKRAWESQTTHFHIIVYETGLQVQLELEYKSWKAMSKI